MPMMQFTSKYSHLSEAGQTPSRECMPVKLILQESSCRNSQNWFSDLIVWAWVWGQCI